MKAMYQNNFNRLNKYIQTPDKTLAHFNPWAYPYHDEKLTHAFLYHGFDPWKDLYSSYLNHVSLYQVNYAKQISSLPFLLVRDGLFTMLEFFHRCPNPKEVPGVLLIHNCLRDFIPDKWRSKVLFYEFEYKNFATRKFQLKNNEVLLKANIDSNFFDYEKTFQLICELKAKGYKKFNLFFFLKQNHFLSQEWAFDYLLNEYVLDQSKFLERLKKANIQFEMHTWKEFFNCQNMHLYDCYDLNSKEKYYIDDFSNYTFLKKGAEPLNLVRVKGNRSDLFVPTSSFHGIRILGSEPQYQTKKITEIYKDLKMFDLEKMKFDAGVFQMINEVAGAQLDSAWIKTFS
jgi:hypothetical protein